MTKSLLKGFASKTMAFVNKTLTTIFMPFKLAIFVFLVS